MRGFGWLGRTKPDRDVGGWAATLRRCLGWLALLPGDPRTERFLREIDVLTAEAGRGSGRADERCRREWESLTQEFGRHQSSTIHGHLAQFDASLRQLAATLELALASHDELAATVRKSMRALRYGQGGTEPANPDSEAELNRLTAALQESCDHVEAIRRRYSDEAETLRSRLDLAQRTGRSDPLTRLPNLTALEYYLATAATRARDGERSSLAFVRLEGLRELNSTFGQAGGDAALLAFADAIGTAVGRPGFLARLSGGTFGVVFGGGGTRLIERLESLDSHLASHPVELSGETAPWSARWCVLEIDGDQSAAELLRRAEARLAASRKRAA